jgi:hypothetical protein
MACPRGRAMSPDPLNAARTEKLLQKVDQMAIEVMK